MITYITDSDIFNSHADALVNPVNCKGVMGKGIALEFKKRFPEIMPIYKEACNKGKLSPGTLLFVRLIVQPDLFGETKPGVILFPTKIHWRDKSKIEWIEQGFLYLKEYYKEWGLNSIAMPQIGCGLGGLPWEKVNDCIKKYFLNEPVAVEVYLNNSIPIKEKKE